MTQPAGHTLPLTPARRFTCDLLANTRRAPTASIRRRLRLAPVAAARRAAAPPPTWCAVFTRAYALVAAAQPELRRVFADWPWPHLYEYPDTVAAVAVAFRLGHEDVVGLARLHQPQDQGLRELEEALWRVQE